MISNSKEYHNVSPLLSSIDPCSVHLFLPQYGHARPFVVSHKRIELSVTTDNTQRRFWLGTKLWRKELDTMGIRFSGGLEEKKISLETSTAHNGRWIVLPMMCSSASSDAMP